MLFKVFVIVIAFSQIRTLTIDEKLLITTKVKNIGESLNYPPDAVDKVISLLLLTNLGNFENNEETVLMIEGALYQTRVERYLSGDRKQYDVRVALKRIEETNVVHASAWKDFDESKLEFLRREILAEFPPEVAEIIVNITKDSKRELKTPEQKEKSNINYLALLMDGALAVSAKASQ